MVFVSSLKAALKRTQQKWRFLTRLTAGRNIINERLHAPWMFRLTDLFGHAFCQFWCVTDERLG